MFGLTTVAVLESTIGDTGASSWLSGQQHDSE
jgi:hypothetical protein